MVLTSLNSARAKARNAKRISDVVELRKAFILGYEVNGSLPGAVQTYYCISASCYDTWTIYTNNIVVDSFIAPYLAQKPSDPNGGNRGYGGYLYYKDWAGGTYNNNYFAPGSYINYLLEAPADCGHGKSTSASATLVDCYMLIL